MITQLVYTSRCTFDPASEMGRRHVHDILASARRFNAIHDITGFLLVGTDWFAQVLEGPAHEVSNLFRKLLTDVRHRDVRLVDTRMIRERHFGDWQMVCSDKPMLGLPLETLLGHAEGQALPPFERIMTLASEEALRLRA